MLKSNTAWQNDEMQEPADTVEDVYNRIVGLNRWVLPVMMGKIEVLSPILDLCDREEDLVLDLHDSLSKKRVWAGEEASRVSTCILEKMGDHEKLVRSGISERFKESDYSNTFEDWREGLQTLARLASEVSEIYWERRPADRN